MYEKCEIDILDDKRSNAVILANSMVYASPAHSKKDVSQKQRAWKKFMDSLNYEKLIKQKDKKEVKKQFLSIGLPVKKGVTK